MNNDSEHLKLLSIFHYVLGGMMIVSSSIFIIHIFMGFLLVNVPHTFGHANERVPTQFIGLLLVAVGSLAVAIGWILGGITVYAGKCLNDRRRYTFCMVIAAISCIVMPLGTILGIFTLIVLQRPNVRALFYPTVRA